jgi:hypothetical protein
LWLACGLIAPDARLASAAEAGQVIVTADAAVAVGLDPRLERRSS